MAHNPPDQERFTPLSIAGNSGNSTTRILELNAGALVGMIAVSGSDELILAFM
jgi:hypothetical protein